MSETSIGARILMSVKPHEDLKVRPELADLIEASFEVRSAPTTGGGAEELDRTAVGHTYKVSVAGLKDGGTVNLSIFYEPTINAFIKYARQAYEDGEKRYFMFILPSGDTREFIAHFNQLDDPLEVGTLVEVESGLKISGKPIYKYAIPNLELGNEVSDPPSQEDIENAWLEKA